MKPRPGTAWYALADATGAGVAYSLYLIRYPLLKSNFGVQVVEATVFLTITLVMAYLLNSYTPLHRKSRITEIWRSLHFALFLSFLLMLWYEVEPSTWRLRGESGIITFAIFAGCIASARLVVLYGVQRRLRRGTLRIPTVAIGSGAALAESTLQYAAGLHKAGYYLSDAPYILDNRQPGEILPSPDFSTYGAALFDEAPNDPMRLRLMYQLQQRGLEIFIAPRTGDVVTGQWRTDDLFNPGLYAVPSSLLSPMARTVKRTADVVVAATALVALLPLLLFIAWRVRTGSTGPIIYHQERIGLWGKPFRMYKFRSMYRDAEESGPMLSSERDPRVTPWGRIMRKWRLDELPQLCNVILGDMSLVGPRPERQHYIDQIVKQHPAYLHVQKALPGITSWGMVRYGYAENVAQMIERNRWDLLYVENISTLLDLKIILNTFRILLKGKGK